MRSKILVVALVIFLVLVLVGCGEKEKIKEVIDDYWLALSNQRYELAKTYCIPDGSKYRYTESLQKKERDPIMRTTFTPCITKWNYLRGEDAFVSTEIIITVSFPTEKGILGISATETSQSVELLTKVNGVWKLK